VRGPFFCLFLLSGLAAFAETTIPFRLSRGLILVDANIQGAKRPLHFIVDSGAGETLISKTVAKELNLPLTGQERIRTVRGAENASRAEATRISLGAGNTVRFSPSPLVVDLSQESRTLASPVDGLLGVNFFDGRSIQIDFGASCLRVTPDRKPGAVAAKVPLFRSGGAMFVRLSAAGSPLQRVRLDTGCNRSLCWSPPADSSLGRIWSDGKTMKADVQLGALVVADVPSDVYRKPLFAGEDGLLGTAFLSRFGSVWIDAVNGRVAFGNVRQLSKTNRRLTVNLD
jgi:predicted aspartyl protease